MLTRSVLHKLSGIASSVLLLFAASRALTPTQAVAVLAGFSTIQLLMPLSGFGLGQRLAGLPAGAPEAVPTYLLRFTIGAGLVAAIAVAQAAGNGLSPISLLSLAVIALVAALAENYRARIANQTGFLVLNGLRFIVSIELLVRSDVGLISLSAACSASIFMVAIIGVDESWNTFERIHAEDIQRALHVAIINQFYPLVAVLAAVTGYNEALSLLAVHRANIVLNWQTFFWLRMANKDAASLSDHDRRPMDRRLGRLNLASSAFLASVAVAWETRLLFGQSLSDIFKFGESFKTGLLTYSLLVLVENILIPPYESINLYRFDRSQRNQVAALGSLAVFALVVPAMWLQVDLVLAILICELVWITIRLCSKVSNQPLIRLQL